VAWKTEYNGNQLDIFGGDGEKNVDRVSFFRRLSINKAKARAFWATIGDDAQAEFVTLATNALNEEYERIQTAVNIGVALPLPPDVVTIDSLRQYTRDMAHYERMTSLAAAELKRDNPTAPPSPGKILEMAQASAWYYHGQPPQEVEEAVLNEDVIFVRKPA
jgi:hypothetical protein